MATDPVQQIRELEHDTPLAMDLTATLARLAALPPSTEAPYLTVSLDWRPEGSAPGRFPPPSQSDPSGARRVRRMAHLADRRGSSCSANSTRRSMATARAVPHSRASPPIWSDSRPTSTRSSIPQPRGSSSSPATIRGYSSRFRSTSRSPPDSLSARSRRCANSSTPRRTIRPTPSSSPINGTPSSG